MKKTILYNGNELIFSKVSFKEPTYADVSDVVSFSGFSFRGLEPDIDELIADINPCCKKKEVYPGIFEVDIDNWYQDFEFVKKHSNLKCVAFAEEEGFSSGDICGSFLYSAPGEHGFSIMNYVADSTYECSDRWTSRSAGKPFCIVEDVFGTVDYKYKVTYNFEEHKKWNTADYCIFENSDMYLLESINNVPASEIFEFCENEFFKEFSWLKEGEKMNDFNKQIASYNSPDDFISFKLASCTTVDSFIKTILEYKEWLEEFEIDVLDYDDYIEEIKAFLGEEDMMDEENIDYSSLGGYLFYA